MQGVHQTSRLLVHLPSSGSQFPDPLARPPPVSLHKFTAFLTTWGSQAGRHGLTFVERVRKGKEAVLERRVLDAPPAAFPRTQKLLRDFRHLRGPVPPGTHFFAVRGLNLS